MALVNYAKWLFAVKVARLPGDVISAVTEFIVRIVHSMSGVGMHACRVTSMSGIQCHASSASLYLLGLMTQYGFRP
jgi:hypothetical protein